MEIRKLTYIEREMTGKNSGHSLKTNNENIICVLFRSQYEIK